MGLRPRPLDWAPRPILTASSESEIRFSMFVGKSSARASFQCHRVGRRSAALRQGNPGQSDDEAPSSPDGGSARAVTPARSSFLGRLRFCGPMRRFTGLEWDSFTRAFIDSRRIGMAVDPEIAPFV
jgi:hypothetical protein